ncbi:MAG: HAD family hydrolase [Coprobacillus sp.]
MMTLKKDKKAFFFDIDGTLAIHGKVPQSTVESLKELKNLGHYIFICTGRPYHYAYSHYAKYADGFITSNGRYIVYEENVLMDEPMKHSQIQHFIEVMRKYHCGFGIIDQDKGFLEVHDESMREDMKSSYYPGYYMTEFKDSDVSGYMFDVYFSNHKDFENVQSELAGEVILNEHFPHPSADATILGIDKGNGIDCVLQYFHLQREDAFAFGDGSNDLCMFQHVEHGIAMGNAIEELKKEAEYVTTSIDNDGIYNALQYYKIIS